MKTYLLVILSSFLVLCGLSGCFSPKVTCSDTGQCPDGELCALADKVCRPASECMDCRAAYDLNIKQESRSDNPGDEFGHAVAISGPVLVVGAWGDDPVAAGGSAYIVENAGGTWVVNSRQIAPAAVLNDRFGFAVAASGDFVAVGAPKEDDGLEVDEGRVHIYQRMDNEWLLDQSIPGVTAGDNFGCSVSLQGTVMAAGACLGNGVQGDTGTVLIYENQNDTWALFGALEAPDAVTGALFGNSVALGDGIVAIGAPGDDDKGDQAGAVYIFEKQGNGAWEQAAKIVAGDGTPGDLFGHNVAVDGKVVAVGAYRHDGVEKNAGAVYIFEPSSPGAWQETSKITAADGAEDDLFGFALALDGNVLAVGAQWNDDRGESSGSTYIFERQGDSWIEFARLTAPDGKAGDGLGFAVAMEGNTLITTAYREQPGGYSGAAYIFER